MPGVVELLGEHLCVGTGAGETQVCRAVDEAAQVLGLVALVDDEDAVVDGARLLVLAGDLVDRRLDEESSTSAATSRSSVAEKRSF